MSSTIERFQQNELEHLLKKFPKLNKEIIEENYKKLDAGGNDANWKKLEETLSKLQESFVVEGSSSTQKRKVDEVEGSVTPIAKKPETNISPPAVSKLESTPSASTKSTSTNSKFSKPLIEEVGDLFSTKYASYNLAHCISADVKLGKGIAKLFVQKFGGNSFKARIRDLNKGVGEVAPVIHGTVFIYNLITKPLYHNKPTYETLEQSLEAMKKHAIDNKVNRIAMPQIGCGLDGLQWRQVSKIINNVFGNTSIQIVVVSLPPKKH